MGKIMRFLKFPKYKNVFTGTLKQSKIKKEIDM